MRPSWLQQLVFLILVFSLLLNFAFAGQTGKIVGKVYDSISKEPLPGVNVVLEGTTMGAACNLDGQFMIIGVPPGTYVVKAEMMGYTPYRIENVKVNTDKTTSLDFPLSITILDVGASVTVVAERPMVQRDLTSSESIIDADAIKQMPVQNFDEVVNLQAGVIDGHFRGGRIGEVMYMIDGIPVNDVYSGNFALQVETNAIQELQIISGTFNAEYGQAMSGIVNIVTKEGSDYYTGELSTYFSDFISNHKKIFWNIDKLNLTSNFQGNLSGPFPVFGDKLTFYASGRYLNSEGHIYGKNVFKPSDHSDFTSGGPDNPSGWIIQSHGEDIPFSEENAKKLINGAEAIPLNDNLRLTGQVKVAYKLSGMDKISYEALIQNNEWGNYDHRFRLNPEGNYNNFQNSYNNILVWNHLLSERAFFTVRFANFHTKYKQYVYESPNDPNYVSSQRLQDSGANAFLTGGMQMWNFQRSTTSNLVKFDMTYQITNIHLLKFGMDAKKHKLWLREYEVVPALASRIPPLTSYNNNQYKHDPIEASAFFQDKIELDYMIVNAGIRFDYFQPDGLLPIDFLKPDASATEKAETSTQISPRIGLAYPITDRGVVHVSYGHFFQVPTFEYLYTNPEFDIFPLQSTPSPPPNSLLNTVGNASLKPQKTVIYEIGLQQQLGEEFVLDVTGFYKDIRNLLGTEVKMTLQGIRYGRYINRDYGNIRGITIAFEKRPSNGIAASIDYTFQIAKGNASDPNNVFLDQQTDPPTESEKQMVSLNWDRRHQVNCSVTLGDPGNYGLSFIARFGTGFPYTPSFENIPTAVENSARRPNIYSVDIYTYKNLKFGPLHYSLFLRVFNLFDRLNELNVFNDTGRAGYSLAPIYSGGLRPQGINTLDEYFVRPDFYSNPREIQLGFSVNF